MFVCVCEGNIPIIKYLLPNTYFSKVEHIYAFDFSQFLQKKMILYYFFKQLKIQAKENVPFLQWMHTKITSVYKATIHENKLRLAEKIFRSQRYKRGTTTRSVGEDDPHPWIGNAQMRGITIAEVLHKEW